MDKVKFYNNTDTVDIDNKSLGISNSLSLNDRGLKISIKHNGNKAVYDKAIEIQAIIVKALNDAGIEYPSKSNPTKREAFDIALSKGLVKDTEKPSDYTYKALYAIIGLIE